MRYEELPRVFRDTKVLGLSLFKTGWSARFSCLHWRSFSCSKSNAWHLHGALTQDPFQTSASSDFTRPCAPGLVVEKAGYFNHPEFKVGFCPSSKLICAASREAAIVGLLIMKDRGIIAPAHEYLDDRCGAGRIETSQGRINRDASQRTAKENIRYQRYFSFLLSHSDGA